MNGNGLQILTNSRRSCFNDCPRKHYFRYELCQLPIKQSDALRIGSLIHGALEKWWAAQTNESALNEAMTWIGEQKETDYNAYELELARVLIGGYNAKWIGTRPSGAMPEKEYRCPLLNPATQGESKTFILGGKIDVIVPHENAFHIIEHKTTKEDISPESDYWLRLSIDGQISGYYAGAEAIGYPATDCIYDVIKKPAQRPLTATPSEDRKYKKDGTLYANQRELDESVAEYGQRVAAVIAENPDKYFARRSVARMQEELADYFYDMWSAGREIREAELAKRWPRNPNACMRYGKCEYLSVCCKTADINDETMFKHVDNPNQELTVSEEAV
jgi:hypothetical protein